MARYFFRLALSEAPARCARAFLKSLLAVIVLALAAGVVFLPAEMVQLVESPSTAVVAYAASDGGRLAAALVRTVPNGHREGMEHRVVVQDLTTFALREIDLRLCSQPLCVATSFRDARLLIGDENGSIYRLDLRGKCGRAGLIGRHLRGLPHTLACSTDGRTLISADSEALYAWDLDQWTSRWIRNDLQPTCVAVLPDSRSLFCQDSGKGQKQVLRLDIETGAILQVVDAIEPILHEMISSPDGRFLAGIGAGGRILLWRRDASDPWWRRLAAPEIRAGTTCVTAAFSPDSRLLVTGDVDGTRVALWDFQKGTRVCQLGDNESAALGAKFLDAETLLTWNSDGTLRWWRWKKRSLVRRDSLIPGAVTDS